MSHGTQSDSRAADPNLTPLLDVVLQLIMFFMICTNFVTTQLNKNIVLPVMASARPADKKDVDLLFLNIRADGAVQLGVKDPVKTPEAIRSELNKEFRDRERLAKQNRDNKDQKVKTVVALRADQNVEYKRVYEVMHWCKEIGFRRFHLHATIKG